MFSDSPLMDVCKKASATSWLNAYECMVVRFDFRWLLERQCLFQLFAFVPTVLFRRGADDFCCKETVRGTCRSTKSWTCLDPKIQSSHKRQETCDFRVGNMNGPDTELAVLELLHLALWLYKAAVYMPNSTACGLFSFLPTQSEFILNLHLWIHDGSYTSCSKYAPISM